MGNNPEYLEYPESPEQASNKEVRNALVYALPHIINN